MARAGRVDTDLLVSQLKANGWHWPAPRFVPSIASTNQALLAESPDEGVCLIAGEQTSGRGRGANTWVAPADSSLLLSIALRPLLPTSSWPWVGVLLALAARNAVQSQLSPDFQARLKWPNDIMVGQSRSGHTHSRKVGGVLTQSADGFCVVGVGLNVYQTANEMQPLESAVSLSMVSSESISITNLAALLLGDFYAAYQSWQERWPIVGNEDVRNKYLEVCETVGANVRFTRSSEQLVGQVLDVDQDGQLVVELPDGEITSLNSDTALEVRDVKLSSR